MVVGWWLCWWLGGPSCVVLVNVYKLTTFHVASSFERHNAKMARIVAAVNDQDLSLEIGDETGKLVWLLGMLLIPVGYLVYLVRQRFVGGGGGGGGGVRGVRGVRSACSVRGFRGACSVRCGGSSGSVGVLVYY